MLTQAAVAIHDDHVIPVRSVAGPSVIGFGVLQHRTVMLRKGGRHHRWRMGECLELYERQFGFELVAAQLRRYRQQILEDALTVRTSDVAEEEHYAGTGAYCDAGLGSERVRGRVDVT